jgi:cobalamin biosynthesis protein CobT
MDDRVRALVTKMHSKIPAGQVLTADVCVAVLQKKFGSEFPPATDWNGSVKATVAALLGELSKPSAAATTAVTKAAQPAKAKPSDSDDSDSSDESSGDDSDDDAGASYNSEEDEDASSGDEESDEEFESDESSEEEGDEEEAAAAEAALKKNRTEGGADSGDSHTLDMVKFARKAGFAVRTIGEAEPVASYRTKYLDGFFADNKLDPSDLSKAALKKAKVKAELAALQQEVDMTLDRKSRKGRAQFFTGEGDAPPAPTSKFTADSGLFDDE